MRPTTMSQVNGWAQILERLLGITDILSCIFSFSHSMHYTLLGAREVSS
jgi:hypothetical protein